jgi:uncharacterized membrane protein YfcA
MALSFMLAATAIFLLAGFVKGLIGLGLPTVAIGLLGLMMAPAEAAALLVVPSLLTNVWQLAAGPSLVMLARRLGTLLFGCCIGIWIGAAAFGGIAGTRAGMLLGIALVLYALFGLSARRFAVRPATERWLSPLIGLATGVVVATTGVFTLPAVPYLQALGLDKDELVQALGLSFTVSTVGLALTLLHAGSLQTAMAGASMLALLPSLAGMMIGQRVRTRVPAHVFRLCFFVGLLLLGAHLALRPLL